LKKKNQTLGINVINSKPVTRGDMNSGAVQLLVQCTYCSKELMMLKHTFTLISFAAAGIISDPKSFAVGKRHLT
jgi:hypothetical protein